MASFVKYYDFVEQLCSGKHDLTAAGHTVKVAASNGTPAQTNTVKADITEITAQNGYPAGGSDIQNSISETTGTLTATAVDVVWTASGGSFGPLRYVFTYNDTQTSPTDPLINYWDYGSSVTINNGETFTIDFGASWFTLS